MCHVVDGTQNIDPNLSPYKNNVLKYCPFSELKE
jgi:hypothetical protein